MNDDRAVIVRRMPGAVRVVVTLLLMFARAAHAQSVGPVTGWRETAHGIEGGTAHASFVVTVYSEHVVRLQISQRERPDGSSYALADDALPNYAGFKVEKGDGGRISIRTPSLELILETAPRLRAILRNARGELLNEDMAGDGAGTTFVGDRMTVYSGLQDGERFIGLGEQLGSLDRRGTVVTLRNTDTFKYDDPRLPMYVSIPFFIGLHHDRAYGVFFNNSYRAVFNFGASNKRFASYAFDGGDRDEFFIHAASMAEIIEQYTALTGRMPLPPKWSLGYQQSRSSYYPESRVMWVAKSFRDKQIPLDGIVLDADYLKDYEPFRIDETRFPDMRRLAATLAAMRIELTASVNPGIRIDDSYPAYKDGLAKGVFLRFRDGEPYVADIYPNTNHFPDFTSSKARVWWRDWMKIYADVGIHGLWNDMNEPAIDGQAMPENVAFDLDGRGGTPAEAHNVYGMLMARASFESAQTYGGNRRPFVLSRAGFAGIQRYAAVWSGDNQAKDEHILLGALLSNQMGLAGVPFVGPDVGGFIGDGNRALFERWIEVGAFSPYLRNHRESLAAANEPWAYGEYAETIAKTWIGFRYRLMPYLYSTFRRASETGLPVQRCLCIGAPDDEHVYAPEHQSEFMFGDALLVDPLTSKDKSATTYLPAGEWYDLFSDVRRSGGAEVRGDYPMWRIPLFVRAGAIVPLQSAVQSMRDAPDGTLTVHVYYGNESSRFAWYEDDGATLDYRRGAFYLREIAFDPAGRRIAFGKHSGTASSQFRRIALVLHGFDTASAFQLDGHPIEAREETVRLLDPLADLEPLYFDHAQFKDLRVHESMRAQKVLRFDNAGQIVVSWR